MTQTVSRHSGQTVGPSWSGGGLGEDEEEGRALEERMNLEKDEMLHSTKQTRSDLAVPWSPSP